MWPRSVESLDDLDLAMTAFSPRSRLFALPPQGLGTERVEGLTSYLTRLARAHAVSPRRLIREVVATVLPDGKRLASAARRMCDASTLDGLDGYAQVFAAATAELTIVPQVRLLTLLPLSGVLPPACAGVTGCNQRWCPDCLSEAAKDATEPSRPLVWSLELYRVCHRHHRPMAKICGRCRRPQPFVPRFPDLSRCVYCGRELTNGLAMEGERVPMATDLWIAESLAGLVARLPELDGLAARERFVAFMQSAVAQFADGNRARLCRELRLNPSTLDNWLLRDARPSLPQLLAVAYGLGVRPAEMLMPSAKCLQGAVSVVGTLSNRQVLPRLDGAERARLARTLADIVQDRSDVRSLADVGQSLGEKRWRLKYWFPDACAAICRKNELARTQAVLARRGADYRVVAKVVRELALRGHYPARRRVNEALRAFGKSLSRRDMMDAYRGAVRECRRAVLQPSGEE